MVKEEDIGIEHDLQLSRVWTGLLRLTKALNYSFHSPNATKAGLVAAPDRANQIVCNLQPSRPSQKSLTPSDSTALTPEYIRSTYNSIVRQLIER